MLITFFTLLNKFHNIKKGKITVTIFRARTGPKVLISLIYTVTWSQRSPGISIYEYAFWNKMEKKKKKKKKRKENSFNINVVKWIYCRIWMQIVLNEKSGYIEYEISFTTLTKAIFLPGQELLIKSSGWNDAIYSGVKGKSIFVVVKVSVAEK